MRVRYRFGDFTVSPARRHLLRAGREVPLVPRYFDLLVLLLERRDEAVHRRDIFDTVWSDVVVSDGALSQAVRTLRRALGDDPRGPAFIRTISRHGYRFVHPSVVEEPDEGPVAVPAAPPVAEPPARETALERLLDAGLDVEDRREAAEALHALGTEETLRLLDRRPGHEAARALLRDSRFDVPGAGPVPLLGQPGGWTAARLLVLLRLRRALRVAGARWGGAALGGAVAGAAAGALGGVALRLAPGSQATGGIIVALAFIGALIGGLGAA
ncbi:MAG TPA: transcriptional regulator, partial [Vicinamibacteria bacterium]